jgi:hypothetical protein
MRYLVLIAADEAVWPSLSESEQEAEMAAHEAFDRAVRARGTMVAAEALGASSTATTLRHVDGAVRITDGPYAETVEQIGGFFLIDMADLDQMTEVCALLPDYYAVEIRPVIDPTA